MKRIIEILKENLQGEVDCSGAKLGTSEAPYVIKGNRINIDLSGASGHVIIISDSFILRVDASRSNLSFLKLKGDIGVVDLSGANIEELDWREATVLYFDKSGSQIKKEETPGH
jgi:uncharacterized protein YjbI with pentapeptide repeats